MAGPRRIETETPQAEPSLRGNRLIKPISHLIETLHHVGTRRDQAGNRKLFFDQYATLLLLDFFTPSLGSLRALQQATGWEKTRKTLGISLTSLGSLSEAARVFDASHLEPILHELAARAVPPATGRQAEALKGSPPSTDRSSPGCRGWPGPSGTSRNAPPPSFIFTSTSSRPCPATRR